MEKSAISILHSMRKKHCHNVKNIKLVATILIFMLAIDISVIILAKIQTMNLIAWGGLAGLILALGMAMKELLKEEEWIKKIDYFYLGLAKEEKYGNKTKNT